MLHKVTAWRHAVVGVSIVVMAGLAGFRVIGGGDDAVFRAEHFDAKQVTVWPAGADGVRIREVVDIDFGLNERRGYQRIVPNDFGEPIEVTASSDANDDVNTLNLGSRTRIRVGNPAITFTGQHRYVLEYVLPDARISTGELALDIIGTDEEFRTGRFEVVLTGFELTGTSCDTGSVGSFGGCTLERDAAGRYVAVIEPLEPGDGITVGGTIESVPAPDLPEPPARPDPVATGFSPLGIVVALLGVLVSGLVFVVSRWYGSNEVAGGGGAADAAFGDLPAPQAGEPVADVPTYRVPDSRLAELATIEFVPPRGVEPWQGSVLLREQLDDETVSAWFSEMVAREAVVIDERNGTLRLERGPNTARLSTVDQGHIGRLFRGSSSISLGSYDKSFTATWKRIKKEQQRFVEHSGWWKREAPSGSGFQLRDFARVIVPVVFVLFFVGGLASNLIGPASGLLASPIAAVVLSALVVALVAFLAYRTLLPARTATGSALALRTESFRRFLEASEGRHVEWAWKNGLLREYSAWAVALGEATAWQRAVESSNIPHPELALRGPLLVYTSSSAFRSAHTPPSSSGSGGGGGFSGGVGGGGGGGSSGSW